MTPTKYQLKQDLAKLDEQLTAPGERPEHYPKEMQFQVTEPALTLQYLKRGFVVAREERTHDNGHRDVLLHVEPDPLEIGAWHWSKEGPTAPRQDSVLRWDDGALNSALESMDYPPGFDPEPLPDNPQVVYEGDGWDVVAPADRVVENAIVRRSAAERAGAKILRDVPRQINKAEEYDLVEIDEPPVPYLERSPVPSGDG